MDCIVLFPPKERKNYVHSKSKCKANFDDFTDKKIAMIQKKINRRPRQKLNFQTPKYEFYKRIL